MKKIPIEEEMAAIQEANRRAPQYDAGHLANLILKHNSFDNIPQAELDELPPPAKIIRPAIEPIGKKKLLRGKKGKK